MNSELSIQQQPTRQTACTVCEYLAAGEADALERVADLESERDAYRELLSAALDQLHAATERERQHREQMARLVAELRRLRAFLIEQDSQERAA